MILDKFHVVDKKQGTHTETKMGIIIKRKIIKAVIEAIRAEKIMITESDNKIYASK